MNGEQLHQCAIEIANNLPFSQHCHPFGPDFDVFKIFDKMFMLTVEVAGVKMINVKCDPFKSQEYQELYGFIKDGYHMNKKHWISIYEDEDLDPDLVIDLVHSSYELVVSKLNKLQRQRIAALKAIT